MRANKHVYVRFAKLANVLCDRVLILRTILFLRTRISVLINRPWLIIALTYRRNNYFFGKRADTAISSEAKWTGWNGRAAKRADIGIPIAVSKGKGRCSWEAAAITTTICCGNARPFEGSKRSERGPSAQKPPPIRPSWNTCPVRMSREERRDSPWKVLGRPSPHLRFFPLLFFLSLPSSNFFFFFLHGRARPSQLRIIFQQQLVEQQLVGRRDNRCGLR